jgi:hypothetical protein
MSDIPTSGAISLNQMHTEVDGASGSIVSINDADIRALISKGSGVTMSFNEWYGASSSLDTQSLTVGGYAPYVYYTGNWYGAGRSGIGGSSWNFGSMSDGTANWASNRKYQQIYSQTPPAASGSSGRPNFWIGVVGQNNNNSGWNTVTVNGQTFSRSSMTFNNTGAGYSMWRHTYPSYGSTNVFDTNDVGSTFTMVFN